MLPASAKPTEIVFFRDRLIGRSEATVSALSPAAQFGVSVFEGLRGYVDDSGQQVFVFRPQEHWRRLRESCVLLDMQVPMSDDELWDAVVATARANQLRQDIGIRVVLHIDGEGSWHSTQPPVVLVAAQPHKRRCMITDEPLKARTSTWTRISDLVMPPRAKVGANYVNSRYAYLEARRDGYDVPLFIGVDGKVSEGSGACLFMVRRGVLATPPIGSSILESITRESLLELARECGIQVDERPIDRSELYLCDELFLCGSAAELSPICSVDRRIVGSGTVGHITRSLHEAYLTVASGRSQVRASWLRPVYDRT